MRPVKSKKRMKILSKEMAQHYQISSLMRGHLVFTSFISYNGKILFLKEHLERLLKGADFLFPNYGWSLHFEKLKQYVESEYHHLNLISSGEDHYFRLNISEDSVHLQSKVFVLNPETLKLTSALKIKTPGLVPSFVKLSNYVDSDLELVRAKFKNFDDVLFYDNFQNITETTTSNIFILNQKGEVMTPGPSSMVLGGVTRIKLIEKLKNLGMTVLESPISKTELLNSKEIWLTNSVKGLRFVLQFEEKVFEKKNSLFENVSAQFGRYGEKL